MSIWHLKKDTAERWCWGQPFTPEGCEKIISIGQALQPTYALRDVSGVVPFRNKTCSLPINDDTRWIFETCTKVVLDMNTKFFEFDLFYIKDLQFVAYEDMGDFHDKHLDMQYESTGVCKLSFMIQLSDPQTYQGSELHLHYDKEVTVVKKDQGAMVLYPSYSLNETTTHCGGKRYVLMGWVVGPKFK
jgi:PKHD-type hydroxylase